jgi:hypothetical protein
MIAFAPAQLVAEVIEELTDVEEQLQGDAAGATLVDRLDVLVEVAGERAELGPDLKVDPGHRLRQAAAEDDAADELRDADAVRVGQLDDLVELGLGEPDRRQGQRCAGGRPSGAGVRRAAAAVRRRQWVDRSADQA